LLDDYAGVLICADEEGNEFLSKIEPPEHNDWNPDLIDDDVKESKIKLNRLLNWVREMVRSLGSISDDDAIEIPGTQVYMREDDDETFSGYENPDELEEPGSKGPEEIERPEGVTILPKAAKTKKTIKTVKTKREGKGGKGKGGKRGTGGEPHSNGQKTGDISYFMPARTLAIKQTESLTCYTISVKPEDAFKGKLKFTAAGDEGGVVLTVVAARQPARSKQYITEQEFITGVEIKPGEPLIIEVDIPGSHRYAIGVEAYEKVS
jgi:hypothetical protein